MNSISFRLTILAFAVMAWCAAVLSAQSRATIALTVDVSDAPQKIVHTRMAMPVKPGPLTLYYPKWVPGMHMPGGPIGNVAGLKFTANGKTIPWRRDLLDVFKFHLEVPAGVQSLEVALDLIQPSGGGASASDKLVVVNWNQNVLYPAGPTAEEIIYKPTLRMPQGWKFGTALVEESASGNEVTFQPVSLERLVDSPVVVGEYFRSIDITPSGEPIRHVIDIVADSEAALEMTPETVEHFKNLVVETGKIFGARHYREYHFLLTLSDHVAHFGLEHHESNDSRAGERALLGPRTGRGVAGLLAHEFAHSWCGKFRRPADLTTPNYEVPMQTDLLWVYEGLTTYLGNLLPARSGFTTLKQYGQHLADTAAGMGPGRPGRTWRPLQDTADAIHGLSYGRGGWTNWRRGSDYYPEGDLLWFEVATVMHRQSQGKKSLDDFCRLFFGGPNNGPEVKTYTFEELNGLLNQVVPYDWASFFRERLDSTSPDAPTGGIEAAGWKLEYSEEPPERGGGGRAGGGMNATYSIGLSLGGDGTVQESIVGGPAYNAGITQGMRVVAVNGRALTADVFREALKAGKKNSEPIRLLVLNNDYYKTYTIDYHGGEKFPRLVRDESKADLLEAIVKPFVEEKKKAPEEETGADD